ncbi:MAG: hypothetical protein H0T91_11495 [Propionibacteriaceae bacterium]|nr:hypothetical protein [Propionibacteriaceae bacterium]
MDPVRTHQGDEMDTVKSLRLHAAVVGFVAVAMVALLGVGVSRAQETPVAGHPAHIHVGTCAELDPNPLAPLTDVTGVLVGDNDDEAPTGEDIKGAIGAPLVEYSESTEIEVPFDDVLATSHAINVHESAENIQNYIACGDIGGVVKDDTVFVGLYEQNGTSYTGLAVVKKNGDDKVDVTIYLVPPAAAPAEEMTPTPAAPEETPVVVEVTATPEIVEVTATATP